MIDLIGIEKDYRCECLHCDYIWYIGLPKGTLRKDAYVRCPECHSYCDNFEEVK